MSFKIISSGFDHIGDMVMFISWGGGGICSVVGDGEGLGVEGELGIGDGSVVVRAVSSSSYDVMFNVMFDVGGNGGGQFM